MVKNNNKKLSKSKSSKKSKSSVLKGGDAGRFVMPPAYYGKGTEGYYGSGSPELNSTGKQHAVSQGTISENGQFAGPNLFPMKGGNCKRKSKKNKSSKNQIKNKKRKTNKKTKKY